jgi:hypothetical protein
MWLIACPLYFLFQLLPDHPILLGALVTVLFVIGFIIVWKRASKKDKKE